MALYPSQILQSVEWHSAVSHINLRNCSLVLKWSPCMQKWIIAGTVLNQDWGLSCICNWLWPVLQFLVQLSSKSRGYAIIFTYLLIQSSARIKKSLWSWCSSLKMEHCSNVTDMDVRSLALLQQVKRTPFSLRQIWNTGRCQRAALFTLNSLHISRPGKSHSLQSHTNNKVSQEENCY